ncbi:hypothetical protein Runsl_4227 [Runella slithyformis DSM 19594]|uniref:Uncharacterized protein n=1 Tax=Runella slithyformis (strain ATCC 29530 / DSM 19594 / LMG 11500 / NCIMB 11436 / LSU 4) TaxID=761193 RepID=A0A7U3ZNQ6_RUNSL|nr:hypothetical protein Runsl_4227 [Runella slithyformis DSM 19594]
MKLRYLESLAGLVGPLQTASSVQYAVFKEHYAQRGDNGLLLKHKPLQAAQF